MINNQILRYMVFEVSIKELLQRYGINLAAKELAIYYDNTVNGEICNGIRNNCNRVIKRFVKENNIIINLDDDMIGLMSLVNKMVKDKDNCPSRYRNRFYSLKHKVIKRLNKCGIVDEVIDNGNYYLFKINGYEFHQNKLFFKNNNVETSKVEEYTPSIHNVTFDYDTYKLAMSTMAFFVNSYYSFDKCVIEKKMMKVGDIDKCKKELIEILYQFNEGNLRFFKRVWANNDIDISIEDAVNNLDIERLLIVYFQAKNTVKKIN